MIDLSKVGKRPWRREDTFTAWIYDADRNCVIKCRSEDEAALIVAAVNQYEVAQEAFALLREVEPYLNPHFETAELVRNRERAHQAQPKIVALLSKLASIEANK